VKPVKLGDKTVPHAIAAATAARAMLEESGPKSVACASGSNVVGGTSGSKIVGDTSGSKHHVPRIGALARASLEESQESSSHGQTTKALAHTTAPRPEPCGPSS
jgi:hypothetical protein